MLKSLTLRKVFDIGIVTSLLILIAYLSVSVRLSTLSSPTVLDYDPWWFYRHAKEILENGYRVPEWDMLSYFPPGRPAEKFQGWPYTMVIFYEIARFFFQISFTELAKLSPAIMAALATIPAFFLGRFLSNNWGGLATALFATLSPTLIGVSMAGYCDTDMVVVFYTLLSVFSVFLAIKKRSPPYYILAVLVNLAFVYSWGRGWIPLLLFTIFIPVFVIFRVIEEMIVQRRLRLNLIDIVKKSKSILISLIIIIIATNVIGLLFNFGDVFTTLVGGWLLISGKKLLVNVSVAELQPLSIFTRAGFEAVVGRIGLAPTLFTLLGIPFLILFGFYKKMKVNYAEIYLFLWAMITFYLIVAGVRFSLLFSTATAVSAGYVIGSLIAYIKNNVLKATFFGFTMILVLMFISNAIVIGTQGAGMQISNNWYDMLDWLKENADKDALIATWWDPGHIIAGYTGLKVHADGAHCGIDLCIPYNHNVRIQDMGRIFTTNDENESIEILRKYIELTPEQCQKVKQEFDGIVPEEVCKPVTDVYMIASADLIGKYYWMSYFGDCLKKFGLRSAESCYTSIEWFKTSARGGNFLQLSLSNYDPTQGVLTYGGGQILLVRKADQWVPILNMPEQGIRNVVIGQVMYFEDGAEKQITFENVTNAINGMLWVDPSYRWVIFMDPEIRDSIFTRMFLFGGKGLEHFELVYQNPEIRLFKAIF